jgi:uncharacterized membrane protein
MTAAAGRTPRGTASTWLWLALWVSLVTLAVTMAIDGVGRRVPAVVWLLWYLPIAVFIPGMLRDRLRSMAWLSFVTLMYFVAAVQRIFAEPGSARAQVELLAVIALFLATMFYVRVRGPELRAARGDEGSGAEAGTARDGSDDDGTDSAAPR